MNYLLLALFSVLLFHTIRSTELVNKKDENKALPLKGLDSKGRTDAILTPPDKVKDRGWHNWNSHSLESDNEWSNSWNEPSLAPLPQQNWGNNGRGKPCCGGKNNWGLPNLVEQTNSWNEPSVPELLPPPLIPEPDRSWSGSQWSQSEIGMSDSKDEEWGSGPSLQWDSLQSTNEKDNKPICNCEERPKKQTQEPQTGKYHRTQNYPPVPSYSQIRPNRPQRQPAWNHFENLPWSSWERGVKDIKLPKATDKIEELEEGQDPNETEATTSTVANSQE